MEQQVTIGQMLLFQCLAVRVSGLIANNDMQACFSIPANASPHHYFERSSPLENHRCFSKVTVHTSGPPAAFQRVAKQLLVGEQDVLP
jgi:hypothetical protein